MGPRLQGLGAPGLQRACGAWAQQRACSQDPARAGGHRDVGHLPPRLHGRRGRRGPAGGAAYIILPQTEDKGNVMGQVFLNMFVNQFELFEMVLDFFFFTFGRIQIF